MATLDINLTNVQPTLVNQTNIKSINGTTILGSGDLTISTGLDRNTKLSLTKGLISGGIVTINADPTKIDITAGTGVLVDDWTDPQNPVVYDVSWGAVTALAVTYLGTSTFSNILIDNTGAVVQLEDDPTDAQRRDNIYLARLGHTNLTSVQSVVPKYSAAASPMSQVNDLLSFIGLINIGNIVSANGANLSINKSTGQLYDKGVNYVNTPKTPNTVTMASATAPTIRRRTQTGNGTSSAFLDVANYDVGGTITALSGTKYTNQRVFLFPNGNIIVQYGQVAYNSLSSAIAGLETEAFVVFENLSDACLIGIISVRSTATDLSDAAQAYFGLVSKFGEIGIGSGGGTTTATARTNLGLAIGTDVLAPTGSAASLTSFPTFNQNTTGTASNVTGTVAVANGGTGGTTASGARTNLGLVIGTDVLAPTGSAASLTGFPTFNQNTTGTAASTPKLLTTNFTIEESGGKLLFKYGATTIASMSSTGVITSATNIVANGTP